ncbi:ketopantoate reductase family protein [Paenibacillus rigui]|nr:2-dehydropantoate 2-reductase [Paenibacillus rigui]
MRVEIIGAGALGMMIAASLTGAGHEVRLVTRTLEQADAIRSKGLLLSGGMECSAVAGDEEQVTLYPSAVYAYDELQQDNGCEADAECVLLMVKQTAITDAFAAFVGGRIRADGRLVCFQNGIGHTEALSRFIPASRMLLAVTTEGALRHSLRHVEHTGRGLTWIGALAPDSPTAEDNFFQKKLQSQLQNAGFAVSLSNQITSKVWNKLLINAVINPLTAVLQVTNGALIELPALSPLMRSLYEEACGLADKLGIPIAPDLWEQVLEVCRLTANNRSSMLQDVQSRRRTELDSITGGLLVKARETGYKLPTHEAVYALVRSIEQQWETQNS